MPRNVPTTEFYASEPPGDKIFSSAMDEPKIFITLGRDTEFGIAGDSLFIRTRRGVSSGRTKTIDLGPATKENFRRMVNFMNQMEMHMS